MSDKALEKATEAAYRAECRRVGMEPADWSNITAHRKEQYREMVGAAVVAYLDALCADLPEEAVEGTIVGTRLTAASTRPLLRAFLRSLRGSTPGHREGRDDG